MKTLLAIFAASLLAASASAQTIRTLGYNTTNNTVIAGSGTIIITNGLSAAEGNALFLTNTAEFTTPIWFGDRAAGINVFEFEIAADAAIARTNLGLGGTWLTNTDVTNFRTAIGFGATNNAFSELIAAGDSNRYISLDSGEFFGDWDFDNAANFQDGVSSSGNIVISNQSATNKGILFIYRTNNESFLGLANLIASNNTTVSNETLFRVGVAEDTNKSAQFGFRTTNTNGTGVAVFSVFGYNALAMVGPSARSATNTNGIEADIYSISPTNKVATLIDTNTGATLMHRPVGFTTNASAPANTTNVVGWIEFYVGTNSVRVPYYQ